MRNIDVINSFVERDFNYPKVKTRNLHINCIDNCNLVLINYSTPIAFLDCTKIPFKLYINATKYSQTTSTIQNKLRYTAKQHFTEECITEVQEDQLFNIIHNS